jgi:D-apionolactonase
MTVDPYSDFLVGIPRHAPRDVALRAGPLRVFFRPSDGSLRAVRCGPFEAIRAIYAAIRDRNWATIPASISNLQIEEGAGSFQVRFDARCIRREIEYDWRGKIEGRTEGTITFDFEGLARSTFLRNRIGLCVLHPASCAGMECEVEHPGGGEERGRFPVRIAPRQPFLGIGKISHQAGPGVRIETSFEGEVFEMEDQRNWSDASFKTYGTPLEIPFPVRVTTGARVHQRVTIRALGNQPLEIGPPADGPIEVHLRGAASVLPPLGLGIASHGRPLSARESGLLRLLGLDHLRADLRFGGGEWRAGLARSVAEAGALGAHLHLALFLTADAAAELLKVGEEVRRLRAPVSLWLIHRTGAAGPDADLARLARERLAPFAAPLAIGTDHNFCELNRNRPDPDSSDLPCYSMNPQVHAFDAGSLVETIEAQPETVETARTFSPNPVVISPITLRPRSNPDATAAVEITAGALPPEVDIRQASLFAAGWTAASIAALARTGGAHSLTYFETTGWRGVMEGEEGSPLPAAFPSVAGAPFPVFHLFHWVAGYERVLAADSSDPLRVAALALEARDGRRRLIVANLTGEAAVVRLPESFAGGTALLLDEAAARSASLDPAGFIGRRGDPLDSRSSEAIVLGPCALDRIDA